MLLCRCWLTCETLERVADDAFAYFGCRQDKQQYWLRTFSILPQFETTYE